MALIHKPLLVITRTASAAVNQYRFIDFQGSECALNEAAVGVSLLSVEAGDKMPVATHGIVKIECSAVITEGSLVSVAANGLAKAQFGSERIVGRALEGGTTGDFISIILINA